MIRRWLLGCLLPSALCLSAVGCTTTVEQLTGGLVGGKDGFDPQAPPRSDQLTSNEQLRLHLDTARQMDQAGNDEAALAEYERVLQLDPSNLTAMRRLCVLYDRRGSREDFKKAEEFYQKIAKARPKDPDVWNDWGYSLYLRTDKEHNKENWAAAEQKLRHALELDPKHARAHGNLGLVMGELDRYPEAYREFLAAHLSESEAHCDMAFVYATKGRFEDAKQECRLAREKDPANAKALDLLTKLEQPMRSRDKTAGRSTGSVRTPLTPEEEEKEHEFARRMVAGADDKAAPAPVPPGAFRANGQMWMPIHSGPMPVLPAATPPVLGGSPGTMTFDN